MSMSITPAELVLFVELLAAFRGIHGRDPDEREEKILHLIVRMMLADSTRAIRESSGELRELVALIEDLVQLLRDANALVIEGASLRAALASLASIVLPPVVIH